MAGCRPSRSDPRQPRSHPDRGAAVALPGVAVRQWPIVTPGRFSTGRVTICRGHQVVTSGPYRFVRHLGYAGTLLTVAGLAVTLRNWLSLLAV